MRARFRLRAFRTRPQPCTASSASPGATGTQMRPVWPILLAALVLPPACATLLGWATRDCCGRGSLSGFGILMGWFFAVLLAGIAERKSEEGTITRIVASTYVAWSRFAARVMLLGIALFCLFVGPWAASASSGVHSGRPFRRLLVRRWRPSWPIDAPDAESSVVQESEHRVADAWRELAREEMSAARAFSRLALELECASAPADLCRAARRAADEERGHARLLLEGAERLDGRTVHGDERPTGDVRPRTRDEGLLMALLVYEGIVDGLFNEGIAADMAKRSSNRASHDVTRAMWRRIESEERGHADLALDVVAWALRTGGTATRWAFALGTLVVQHARPTQSPIATGADVFGGLEPHELAACTSSRREAVLVQLASVLSTSPSSMPAPSTLR